MISEISRFCHKVQSRIKELERVVEEKSFLNCEWILAIMNDDLSQFFEWDKVNMEEKWQCSEIGKAPII